MDAELVDEETFFDVLDRAQDAVDVKGIPYLLIGGIAAAALGTPRWTHDIDLFVRPTDATAALDALDDAGFLTETTNPQWIYKGKRDGVLVDVIFRTRGDIVLDDEMLERSVDAQLRGHRVRAVSPEDLLVIKAIVNDEDSPLHWFDALALLGPNQMDWDYLIRRASKGIRRVLSLLVYAQSTDLAVPNSVIERLTAIAYPHEDGR